jgi:hypothetical protein
MVEISLGTHTDGAVYGPNKKGVMRVDSKTFEVKLVGEHAPGVTAGWVPNEHSIHFASGVHLVRWEWGTSAER